jgi:hypothetical protein
MNYATVIPATKNRNGYMVAARTGDSIRHLRLEARDLDAVRAEAQRLYPDRLIVLPGEPIPAQ